ncbi:hypothetical protein CISIN_1g044739mg [Citrus sinensis]|uniref:Uncharacterized protein n=1 Tax=Citrus sinensis TaxID=2711 RepID=A0A067FDD2_CITSI|nr:hypothetical protein CISIN_1g044739mg [Citrus sinensis]
MLIFFPLLGHQTYMVVNHLCDRAIMPTPNAMVCEIQNLNDRASNKIPAWFLQKSWCSEDIMRLRKCL